MVSVQCPIANSRASKEILGQFLTPPPIARFMASLFGPLPVKVRLLDAGAGAGALTLAFVERCCAEQLGVKALEVFLYEVDPGMLDRLQGTLRECDNLCRKSGIRFEFHLRGTDFIHDASEYIAGGMFQTGLAGFDAAIVNPPYRKIGADSPERRALRAAGIEATNLYAGFIALIQRMLSVRGQIVAITPRSFCNGPYFRAFREDLLREMEIQRLHVFDSRRAAFRDDGVLQENIVFHAVKGRRQSERLIISSSSGEPGAKASEAVLSFQEIVYPDDPERFIHIPAQEGGSEAKRLIAGLSGRLASLGLSVSTGRVVDFRHREALREENVPGTVPLVYPCHFKRGTINWPHSGGRKPNAILDNSDTRSLLVPAGVYVLTKRFSSKEERRRLVACLFDPGQTEAEWVGFENHLNYFHANGGGLERTLALGLHAFLNSTIADRYFRDFSGHTQVNATDLRRFPYPDAGVLRAIGRKMKRSDLNQDEIDQLVEKHIHVRR